MADYISRIDTISTYLDRMIEPSKDFRLLTSDSGPAKIILIQKTLGERGKWVNRLHEANKWKDLGVLHVNPEILKATATLPVGTVQKLEKGAKVLKQGNKAFQKAIPLVSRGIQVYRLFKGYRDGNTIKEAAKLFASEVAAKTVVAEAASIGMAVGSAICPGVGTVLVGGVFAIAAGWLSDECIDKVSDLIL